MTMNYLTRRAVRQLISPAFGDGLTGITTGAGTTTSIVDAARVEKDHRWAGGEILFIDGDAEEQSRIITDSEPGELTTAAFADTPDSGASYELFFYFTVAQYHAAISEAVRRARGKHFVPWFWDGLTIVEDTFDYDLPIRHDIATVSGTSSGDTNTLRASALTQSTDYWKGARVVGVTGDNAGLYTTVESSTSGVLELSPAFPNSCDSGDTYHLTRYLPNYLYFIEHINEDNDLTPTPMMHRDWNIIYAPGPKLRFANGQLPPVGNTVRIYGFRFPEFPTIDMDPVEVPEDYAENFTYWQLLRSQPRRPEFKLNNDLQNKQDAWDKAQLDLSRERFSQYRAWMKKV